jgi:phosphohistidine phosphatase
MKTLFILRHAEAASERGEGDFARALTPRGIDAAAALGRVMTERGYAPDFVLCSPARRTMQTLENVIQSIKRPAIEYDRKIYETGHAGLMSLIQNFNDIYDSAMIVGHNPAIHQLAANMALDDSGLFIQGLAAGYAPGTLTVLSCPRARWADVMFAENKITDLIVP